MREANNLTVDIEPVKSSTKRISDIEGYFGLSDQKDQWELAITQRNPSWKIGGGGVMWSPEAPKVSHRMCPSLDLTGQCQAQASVALRTSQNHRSHPQLSSNTPAVTTERCVETLWVLMQTEGLCLPETLMLNP